MLRFAWNSGQQRLNNVDRTHLVLASGKLVLQKKQPSNHCAVAFQAQIFLFIDVFVIFYRIQPMLLSSIFFNLKRKCNSEKILQLVEIPSDFFLFLSFQIYAARSQNVRASIEFVR